MICIPKQFQLGGRTWKVKRLPIIDNDPKLFGDADGHTCTIRVKDDLDPDTMYHTFYHELCHAICFTLGWDKMNTDEDKIDALANVILQFEKSKKGES